MTDIHLTPHALEVLDRAARHTGHVKFLPLLSYNGRRMIYWCWMTVTRFDLAGRPMEEVDRIQIFSTLADDLGRFAELRDLAEAQYAALIRADLDRRTAARAARSA